MARYSRSDMLPQRSPRTFATCVLFVALLTCSAAQAEPWVAVGNYREADPNGISYDVASISGAGGATIEVTWREGFSSRKSYRVKTGILDCQALSISLIKMRFKDMPELVGTASGKEDVIDFTSDDPKKRTLGGLVNFPRYSYPTFASDEGQLIDALCRKVGPDWDSRLQREVTEFCAVQKSRSAVVLCNGDPVGARALWLSAFRIAQAKQACDATDDVLNTVLEAALAGEPTLSEKCSGKNMPCVDELDYLSVDLGKDIADSKNGSPCQTVAARVAAIAEANKKRQESVARFAACVKLQIAELDDGLSPANVVADGVYVVCQAALALASPVESETTLQVQATIKPSVVASILAYRAAVRAKMRVDCLACQGQRLMWSERAGKAAAQPAAKRGAD
jgi:hypothetical protein